MFYKMNKLIAVLGGLSVAQAAVPAGFPATCNDDAGYVVCPDNTDFTGISVEGTWDNGWTKLDLSHAVLRGATFKFGDFRYVNLQQADLTGATWTQVDTFQNINFQGANLEGATLNHACNGCSFQDTNLFDANIAHDNTDINIGSGTCLTQGCDADVFATQCPTCPTCPDTNGFIDPSDAGELADAVRANPTAYQQAGLCM